MNTTAKLWVKPASSAASIELLADNTTVKRVVSKDIFGRTVSTKDYAFRNEVLVDGDKQYPVAISEWIGKEWQTKARIDENGNEIAPETFQNIDAYDIIPEDMSHKAGIIALMDRAGYYYDEKAQQLASDGVILVRRKNEMMHAEANRYAKKNKLIAQYSAEANSDTPTF